MAFGAWVQGTQKDAGSTTSTTLAYGSNVTAGNTLIILVRHGGSTDDTSVSDNLNGAWTKDQTLAVTSSGVQQTWRFSNTVGGACTVTVAFTSAATMRFVIDEYTGNFALDAASKITQGNDGSPTTGSVSTTHTCAILGHHICGVNQASTNTGGAGAGYTLREHIDTSISPFKTYLLTEDLVSAQAAGSYTATVTFSAGLTDNWGMAILAYFDASGAATLDVPLLAPVPQYNVHRM